MDKEKETDNFVYYNFQTNIAGETYFDENGLQKWRVEKKNGLCKFNKNTEAFKLEKDKTDSYFFEKNNREVIKIHARLIILKRAGADFADVIDIATG